jgi:drug/metabolite transporter (DMT)-like permease
MDNEMKGTILALMTALISGVSIIANKIFVVGIDPTAFTSVRALIIGLAFFAIIAYTKKFRAKDIKASFRKAEWKALLAIAIVGGAAAFLLFFSGLQMTTGGRAAFIHKTLPIYVAVLSYWFLHEKIPMKQTYSLIIMLLGTVLIFGAAIEPSALWSDPTLGDALVLGATIMWAVENTIARKAMLKGETNWIVSFSRMFIGALILFGAAGVMGKAGLLMSLTPAQVTNILISTAFLFGFVFCWYWSIKLINVSKASTILLLAPVVSMIAGVVVLSEPVPAMQVLGSALILLGGYFVANMRSEMTTGV